jgi:outer membrane receptor protein involved in Fe transport
MCLASWQKPLVRALVSLGLLLAAPPPATAQTTASLEGVVTDQTRGVLPGVSVTAVHIETGTPRTASTDAQGRYRLSNLRIGEYEVKTELVGFQTQARRGIRLDVGQQVVIDFTMAIGEISDMVSVVGEAPVIDMTQATLQGVVDERKVRDLPLNARDLLSLAPLFSGAAVSDTGESSPSKGYGTKLTISGTRYYGNLFLLDGTDIRDIANSAGSAAGVLMGVETVREFTVVTNAFTAEYGNHTGGVFNAVTKSGTNALRGSAVWFHRDDNLDARNFFDITKPDFSRNQFGVTGGGPIVRDRMFFFASYEGLRETLGLTQRFTVPTVEARAGRLPGAAPATVHPEVQKWLNAYPVPNGADFGAGRAEYIRSHPRTTNQNFATARIDHRFNNVHSVFARYTHDKALRENPSALTSFLNDQTESHYLTLDHTAVASSNFLNRVMFGFARTKTETTTPLFPGVDLPALTFTGQRPLGQIGVFNIGTGDTTFSSLGGNTTNPRPGYKDNFQIKNDISYNRGRHAMKIGAEIQFHKITHGTPFDGAGTYTFRTLAEAYAGRVDQFNALFPSTVLPFHIQQKYAGFYVQDDFRMRQNLTFNLGLRYEFVTTPTERDGRVANAHDYTTPGLTLDRLIVGDPVYDNPSYLSFGPRVGIVWDPRGSGKMSVRLGGGIYYDQIQPGTWPFGFYATAPFFRRAQIRARDVTVPIRFPDAFQTQQDLLAGALSTEGIQFDAAQPTVYKWALDIEREVAARTRVEIGYRGTRGVNLMRVDDINQSYPLQEIDGRIFVPPNSSTLHPGLGRVRPRFTDSESDYHAMTLGVNRRFSEGLQFQVSYTLSKSVSDFDNWTGSSDFQNPGCVADGRVSVPPYSFQKLDRGLSCFDTRQNLMINATWELPIGPGKAIDPSSAARHIVSGWSVSSIVRLSSGNPFTVSEGAGVFPNARGSGLDLVPGKSSNPIDPQNPNRYFDPSSFALPFDPARRQEPNVGFIGNLGRNTLIGPGLATVDLMFAKDFRGARVSKEFDIQFRAEVFNLLNRANFSIPSVTEIFNPDGTVRGDVGRITSTRTSARQAQLGIRIVW